MVFHVVDDRMVCSEKGPSSAEGLVADDGPFLKLGKCGHCFMIVNVAPCNQPFPDIIQARSRERIHLGTKVYQACSGMACNQLLRFSRLTIHV